MFAAPSVFCLLVLAAVLPAGHARNMVPYYSELKMSSLSTTENMCSDCTKTVERFLGMLSKPETQELIRISLNHLCGRIQETTALNNCMENVKTYLPIAIRGFLSFAMQKEGDFCVVLGMCAVQPENKGPDMLHVSKGEIDFFTQEQHSTSSAHTVQISPQCTFCLFIIKKLEEMLPTEKTEKSIMDALEKICNLLPDHYKEQCDNFLETYGKQIIDFLLTSATPHTICTLLHLCLLQDKPAMVPYEPTDCQSCKTLVILTQIHMGQNATGPHTTTMLQKTCLRHPNALPGCDTFIHRHGLTLVRILGKKEAVNACQKFFCVEHE